MKKVMVRYRVKPDKSEENINLIKKVFEELKSKLPKGLKYASFVLPDGVSFVHIASVETNDETNPLSMTEAFKTFQKEIKERCEVPPEAVELDEIGSYSFWGE